MKLAVDATAALGARTGVGVFVVEILRALSARPEVQLRAYNLTRRGLGRGWLPDDVRAGTAIAEIPGRIPTPRVRRLWEHTGVPRLEWFAGAADVVHGPNFVVPPTTGAAAVITVHDVSFEHPPPLGSAATRPHRRSVRDAIARGAWIHTVTQQMASEVRATYDVDPSRVVAVPNGVRLPAAGAHPSPGAPYVLTLGASHRRKELTTLVAAFDALAARHDDLRLLVAGPDGDGAADLARAVGACAHRSRIEQLGWVDDGARGALLRGAAVVAYPSRYEGFGLVPLEAMAAGRPVVAAHAPAVEETAGDAAIYAASGDPDALAAALDRVLTDSALVRQLTARGTARVARFSWDRTAQGLLEVYNRAAATR